MTTTATDSAQGVREGISRLSTVDTAWLRMDDPTNPMVITAVLFLEGAPPFSDIQEIIERRLLTEPRFVEHVVGGGSLRRAVWEPDRRFDLGAHLFRRALSGPDTERQLRELIAERMRVRFDPERPLWEVTVIEGLQGGSALLIRLHHAIADGIALIRLLQERIADPSPLPPPKTAKPRASSPPAPGGRGFHPLKLARHGVEDVAWITRLMMLPPDPRTALKGDLGRDKRVAWTPPIPLERLRDIGRRESGTVNDVLLAAIAGALRRYLESRGQPVDDLTIRAVVPVDLRGPGTEGLGNRFGLVFVPLPIGRAEPLERLRAVKKEMDAIKHGPEAAVTLGLLIAAGAALPAVERLVIDAFDRKASLIVTDVPGPKRRLRIAGAPVDRVLAWVPQAGRVSLGISLVSYAGSTTLGVSADAGLVPDPETIAGAFSAELDVL